MQNLGMFACTLLLAGGLSAPAFAASADSTAAPAATTNGGQAATSPGPMNNSTNLHIAQKLRNDLDKAGFTDIRIMPSSFLVRAKDSAGHPVMMVINPDSITELTEDNMGKKSASDAQHPAGAMNGAAGSSSPTSGKTNP